MQNERRLLGLVVDSVKLAFIKLISLVFVQVAPISCADVCLEANAVGNQWQNGKSRYPFPVADATTRLVGAWLLQAYIVAGT